MTILDYILIYVLVATFTPGPNNIMSSSSSSKIGIIKTLPFMLGVLLGTFIVFVITSYFNVFLFDSISSIEKFVGYGGAIFIAYLAYRIIVSEGIEYKENITIDKLFLKGLLLTFVNPKAFIFGITATGMFLSSGAELIDLVYISIFLAVLCFISVLLWGSFGYLFKTFLSKYYKIFNIIMASLLMYSAVLLIFDTF